MCMCFSGLLTHASLSLGLRAHTCRFPLIHMYTHRRRSVAGWTCGGRPARPCTAATTTQGKGTRAAAAAAAAALAWAWTGARGCVVMGSVLGGAMCICIIRRLTRPDRHARPPLFPTHTHSTYHNTTQVAVQALMAFIFSRHPTRLLPTTAPGAANKKGKGTGGSGKGKVRAGQCICPSMCTGDCDRVVVSSTYALIAMKEHSLRVLCHLAVSFLFPV